MRSRLLAATLLAMVSCSAPTGTTPPGDVTPADSTPPADVTQLDSEPSSRRVTLSWVDPSDADLTSIEVTHDPEATSPVVVTRGTQTKTIGGLTNGVEYTFTVRAVDASGNKSAGAQVKGTPYSWGVWILSVTASPTDSEQVTIINEYAYAYDVSHWTIGDLNNPAAYSIPQGTILDSQATRGFPRTTLGFGINDSGEIIYLKDTSGATIDTWSN